MLHIKLNHMKSIIVLIIVNGNVFALYRCFHNSILTIMCACVDACVNASNRYGISDTLGHSPFSIFAMILHV